MPGGFVYVLARASGTLYVGVTNDLQTRVAKHKAGEGGIFTAKYNVHRLVYFESFSRIEDAIAAEKRIKGWTRDRKLALLNERNPEMRDLSEDW